MKQHKKQLGLVWFDWKEIDEMVKFIQEVTTTQPMCFRHVETNDDVYALVISEQPVSQKEADAFFKKTEKTWELEDLKEKSGNLAV